MLLLTWTAGDRPTGVSVASSDVTQCSDIAAAAAADARGMVDSAGF